MTISIREHRTEASAVEQFFFEVLQISQVITVLLETGLYIIKIHSVQDLSYSQNVTKQPKKQAIICCAHAVVIVFKKNAGVL